MAGIELTNEQQQQLGSLVTALGQDAGLRSRFQADPRAVLGDYGLADLLPADMQFEGRVGEGEVRGLAMGGGSDHWDFSHADSHLDMTIPIIGGYRIVPRLTAQ